jgi:hypothetical protein
MEKNSKPISGFAILLLCLALLATAAYFFISDVHRESPQNTVLGGICVLAFVFFMKGLIIVNPNQARVLTFFGKYVGTVKANGLLWVNPFYSSYRISLRSQNLEGSPLKVNDKMGNPIEIAAVIVWQVSDTYKAAFEVADYNQYVKIQSEGSRATSPLHALMIIWKTNMRYHFKRRR